MVVHEADSYSDSGVTIEVNGGARGDGDSYDNRMGRPGIGGQIIPVSTLLLYPFLESVVNPHTELHHLLLFAAIRLAIWDRKSAVVIVSMERPISMLAVLLACAAVLTRCVGVQVTVIVLQIKCATQLTTSATLVDCLMGNLA